MDRKARRPLALLSASQERCTVLGPNANPKAHLAHKQMRQQRSPRRSADEQLAGALSSCRQVLGGTLTNGRLGESCTASVELFTDAFCKAAHVVQRQLMHCIMTKYFASRHCYSNELTVTQYADELTSLAWALCYPSTSQLLRFLLELYCDETTGCEYVRFDDCGALFESIYTIPPQDIDARTVAMRLTQQLVDYAAALQPISETATKSSPAISDAGSADHKLEAGANVVAKREHNIGSHPSSVTSEGEELAPLNVTILEMLRGDKRLLDDSHGSAYDQEDTRSSSGSFCSSEGSDVLFVHIDTVVRFFRARASKLWPLNSFQAQMRSVFFGDKYWVQLISASEKPTVVEDAAHSIFTLSHALRSMYSSEEEGKVGAPASPMSAKPSKSKSFFRRKFGKKQQLESTSASQSSPSDMAAHKRRLKRSQTFLSFFDRHSR